MIHANINEILSGFAARRDDNTGILIAEKQIFIPEKEMIMLNQNQEIIWCNSSEIIFSDSAFSMEGGRKL
ncbi:MAG: hypothetical protein IKJ99_06125 [Oscillospiraceae bacterium]|nr:hypothetical protein [Oscillospiraceae bacterium]